MGTAYTDLVILPSAVLAQKERPFQGKVACVRIDKGRGVCGTAWELDQVQVVPDVHAFPGHIACDKHPGLRSFCRSTMTAK